MKKYSLMFPFMFLCLCFVFMSCNFQNEFIEDDITFTSCVFDEAADQIILASSTGKYKLFIWLYGNKLEQGEYRVYGSDMDLVLEGTLQKKHLSRDLKTTLFVNYTEDSFQASGTIELYEPNSIKKSGETYDFSYRGALERR